MANFTPLPNAQSTYSTQDFTPESGGIDFISRAREVKLADGTIGKQVQALQGAALEAFAQNPAAAFDAVPAGVSNNTNVYAFQKKNDPVSGQDMSMLFASTATTTRNTSSTRPASNFSCLSRYRSDQNGLLIGARFFVLMH
jgi:hypothetical protein